MMFTSRGQHGSNSLETRTTIDHTRLILKVSNHDFTNEHLKPIVGQIIGMKIEKLIYIHIFE